RLHGRRCFLPHAHRGWAVPAAHRRPYGPSGRDPRFDGGGSMTTFLGMPARAPRGVGHLRGDEPFPVAAREALANSQLRRNLQHATTTIRGKSGRVIAELPDWQELRASGSALKAYTMANLPLLLEQLEEKVTAAGGVVHWAADANEANRIVTDLVRQT